MLLINVNLELLLRAKNCSALFTFGLAFRHANIPSTYNLCITPHILSQDIQVCRKCGNVLDPKIETAHCVALENILDLE